MGVVVPFFNAARLALILTVIGAPAYVSTTGPTQSETTIEASD
jgi:hypothetical protein